MKTKRMRIQEMALISLMAAILCVVGPVTIPVGVVPVSTTIAVLYLLTYVIGMRKAMISCLIYIGIGLIGLPVFAGYSAGPAVLLGPTGGYLMGYLCVVWCSGIFIDRFTKRGFHLIGMLTGLLLCYLLGTIWLAYQANLSFWQALLAGVIPFVIFDLLKIGVMLIFGPMIRRHLKRANLFS